jgi:hypothetical protein
VPAILAAEPAIPSICALQSATRHAPACPTPATPQPPNLVRSSRDAHPPSVLSPRRHLHGSGILCRSPPASWAPLPRPSPRRRTMTLKGHAASLLHPLRSRPEHRHRLSRLPLSGRTPRWPTRATLPPASTPSSGSANFGTLPLGPLQRGSSMAPRDPPETTPLAPSPPHPPAHLGLLSRTTSAASILLPFDHLSCSPTSVP